MLAFPDVRPGSDNLRFVVAACALVPLFEMQRVGVEKGRLILKSAEPTGSVVLDAALSDLSSRKRAPLLLTWVMKRGKQMTQAALAELERAGLVTRERSRAHGIFPRKRWQPDPATHERLKNDVRRALIEGHTPDDATVALMALMAAGKQNKLLWTKEEAQVARANLGELEAGEHVRLLMDMIRKAIELKESAAQTAQLAGMNN